MSHELERLRRQSITDRLEQLQADAERYKDDAYDLGDADEATRWFVLAAALRGTVALLELDA